MTISHTLAQDASRPFRTFDEVSLDEHTTDALFKQLAQLPLPSIDPDELLARLRQILAVLPLHPLQQILDAGRHPDTPGMTLISDLPVDPDLPPTPIYGGPSDEKKTYVSEGVLLALSSLVGEPFSVASEKAGQLVLDVTPVRAGASTRTNQDSAVFLNFHNDVVYDESGIYTLTNPDFLVLGCLRSDPAHEVLTYYADARDIAARLHPDHLQTLRQPQFQLNAPGDHCRDVGREQVLSEVTSIIQGPTAFPEISVSANGVQPLTSAGANALAALHVACREVAHAVALKPGQALLINNRKGLHAEGEFAARHDGTDRWLQRTQVRRSFWAPRYRLQPGVRRVF